VLIQHILGVLAECIVLLCCSLEFQQHLKDANASFIDKQDEKDIKDEFI
jgi:hypothetical protein